MSSSSVKDVQAHGDFEGGGASRTTEVAAGTSSGTDVSLREYLSTH